jgi:hypothetical protein
MKKTFCSVISGIFLGLILIVPDYSYCDQASFIEPFEVSTYGLRGRYGTDHYILYVNEDNLMDTIYEEFCNYAPEFVLSKMYLFYREAVLYKGEGQYSLFVFFRLSESIEDRGGAAIHAFDRPYGIAEYEFSNKEYILNNFTPYLGDIPTNNCFPYYDIIEIATDKPAFKFEITDMHFGTRCSIITLVTKVDEKYQIVFREVIETLILRSLDPAKFKEGNIDFEFSISSTVTNGFYDLYVHSYGTDITEDLEEVKVDKLVKYYFDGSSYQAMK